jgi:glycosyltransferase involved in cell wall biosynthesis
MRSLAIAPLVSVIMPTFNRREFLPAAIESVFAQTLTDWELIIADDGSAAETRACLAALEDPPRVRVLLLEHCGRPGAVRNAGLREARGEYVAFLDSDDLWLPGKLEQQLAGLRSHPTRRWSYTRFALVDAKGDRLLPPQGSAPPLPAGWVMGPLLAGTTVIALPSVLVERKLLEMLGDFDPQLIMCEDDDLWFRLAAASEIDAIDEPLTLVRRHAQHGGSDAIAWRDRRRVFEKMLRLHGDHELGLTLRRLRADMSAGLALSHALAGERLATLLTLLGSVGYAWRYRRWWRAALGAGAHAVAPGAVRHILRRRAHARRHASGVP